MLDAGSRELVQHKFTEHANAPLTGPRRAHADRQDLLAAGQVSESDRASCGLSSCLSRNVSRIARTNVSGSLVSS
jgi:hypothetical protein